MVVLVASVVVLADQVRAWRGRAGDGPPQQDTTASLTAADLTPRAAPAPPRQRGKPVRLAIDRIGVDATVDTLGVNADGQVEVPSLDEPMLAGWYRYGVTPGERGPAVILGHVTTPEPAVFHDPGALERGDTIRITRADGSVAAFAVDAVQSVPKQEFPAADVYGPLPYAGLRLVTCGGSYDTSAHRYRHNIIVYASLRSWRAN